MINVRVEMSGLLELIEELKEEHGSINAAARAIGMPQATLHNLAHGAEPTFDSLRLIAGAKNVPLWKLVQELDARTATS